MTDIERVTVEAEIVNEDAARAIAKAVSVRHSAARNYVLWVRRWHPKATPAEVIKMIERHYNNAIATSGALFSAGTAAANFAINHIPNAPAAPATPSTSGKGAALHTAKKVALTVAKAGAQQVATLLPAGDAKAQFDLTAMFGLAVADIHGMDLDQDQAEALVRGLTNGRLSSQQIADMALDLSKGQGAVAVAGGDKHWATTLADALPGGAARELARGFEADAASATEKLTPKQQAGLQHGAAAVAHGITRFVFGRAVVKAARAAFPEAPTEFPAHLADVEPSQALAAMKDAARATGNWFADTAGTVGSGVASAAGTVSRPFRSVDLDGDGIPDEPQALTLAKDVGGKIAGAAESVADGASKLLRPKK